MSRTVASIKGQAPDNEFREKLLELVQDHEKRNDIKLLDGDELIEELAREFRKIGPFEKLLYEHKDENCFISAISMDEETRITFDKMYSIAEAAKGSLKDCETYALFLYLSDSLRNPVLFTKWIFQWLIEVVKKFKKDDSVMLKFVYGFGINYCELFESLYGKLALKYSFNESDLPYYDRINLPESDVSGFFVHILRQDCKRIASIQRRYIRLEEDSLQNGNEEHRRLIEHFGKFEFPTVPTKSLVKMYISFLRARLANYLLSESHMNKDLSTGKKELKEALQYYEDNSYAVALQASLMVKEDPTGTAKQIEDKFDKAFRLSEYQYVNLNLQTEIRVMGKLGLAYIYNNRGKYNSAEKYCSEALDLKPEAYLKAVIYLNRGRNRLDDDNLIDAEKDFIEASKEPLLRHRARTNLGLVYYKQGLYAKAEVEFNEAIEECPELPHAYYNLGVLYNDEGKKQQADRLFRTAINIDRDFIEARNALKKFHHRQTDVLTDWVSWWFGPEISKVKKVIGSAIILLLGVLIGKACYLVFIGADIPQCVFVMIGIGLVLLLLPCISKLKIGIIELEMESKGESPTLR